MDIRETNTRNPFAKPDGSPIDGKEPDFFAWLKARAKEKFDKLPPHEQKIVAESERALNERMNS